MRAVLALSVVLVLCLAGSPAASADLGKIQPGDILLIGNAQCTLNFVFDGPGGKTYIGTAAHCVDEVGQRVSTSQFGSFGSVAWIGNADSDVHDFAFIQVDGAHESRIDPSLRGYPQYPTGYTTFQETRVGDLIQVSGYGAGYDLTFSTQTKRVAVHVGDSSTRHSVVGPIHWGDSGGPLVHIDSGKAYGIVSRLCINPCTETGPSVQGMILYAAAQGFPVTLRTV